MPEFDWVTADTRQAFVAAGWTPERSVDLAHSADTLREAGFFVSREAEAVLNSFGGLLVQPIRSPEAMFGANPIEFDADDYFDVDTVDEYKLLERRLGTRLSPIASTGGLAGLLLTEDGCLVCVRPRAVDLYGNTFMEGVDLIIRQYRVPRLLLTIE